jgi:ATP-dependent DNA helicase RecG
LLITIDKADINGTIDQQIMDVNKFILKNIPKRALIAGTKKIEKNKYPDNALGELVAKTIIHRNYVITGTYIQVNIFSNRIKITNPDCLPSTITVNNTVNTQLSRNKLIASILKNLKYLEECFKDELKRPILKEIYQEDVNIAFYKKIRVLYKPAPLIHAP